MIKTHLSHWALELIAFYLCRGRRAPEKDKREGIKNNCSQTRMLHVIEVTYERASCSHGNSALFDSSVEFPRFFFVVLSPPRQLGTVITTMMLYSLVCVPPFFTSTTTTLLLFFKGKTLLSSIDKRRAIVELFQFLRCTALLYIGATQQLLLPSYHKKKEENMEKNRSKKKMMMMMNDEGLRTKT